MALASVVLICYHKGTFVGIFNENRTALEVEKQILLPGVDCRLNDGILGSGNAHQISGRIRPQEVPLSARQLTLLGQLAASQKQFLLARELWETAQKLEPGREVLIFFLGQLYLDLGLRHEAVGLFRTTPSIANFFLTKGHLARAKSDWSTAAAAYSLAHEIAPLSGEALFFWAETLNYFQHEYRAASVVYLLSVKRGYQNEYVWSRLAHAHAMAGQYDKALQVLDRHLQDNALANAIRADALRAGGRAVEAIRSYQKSLSQNASDPWVWLYLGYAYSDSGDLVGAASAWREAVVREPDFLPARDALARSKSTSRDVP